jgi:deoxyadenosine/deoxycytidine kinase
MKNNLFYLTGPMGSGKTTFGKELAKANPDILIPELFSRNLKFHTEPNYRRILKIAGRAIENYEYAETADKNPGKIIIGNRCIYDCLAYNKIYYERGWISKETYDFSEELCKYAFADTNPYAIIINPGFETVKKHLEQRWKETKKRKWGEEDMKFVEITCNVFEEFKGKENIHYIDHEVDLEGRIELNEVNEWMIEKCKKPFRYEYDKEYWKVAYGL